MKVENIHVLLIILLCMLVCRFLGNCQMEGFTSVDLTEFQTDASNNDIFGLIDASGNDVSDRPPSRPPSSSSPSSSSPSRPPSSSSPSSSPPSSSPPSRPPSSSSPKTQHNHSRTNYDKKDIDKSKNFLEKAADKSKKFFDDLKSQKSGVAVSDELLKTHPLDVDSPYNTKPRQEISVAPLQENPYMKPVAKPDSKCNCPEPAFECKKVPNYASIFTNQSTGEFPRPLVNDFSKF